MSQSQVSNSQNLPHLEIFFSYAHADEQLRDKLATHLRAMEHEGLITSWHDRSIQAGEKWAEHIDAHLDTADVILLLISADFIASDYCYSVELKRAMERNLHKEARVVPIILRPCDWSHLPFASLQALPTNAKPVTSWPDIDDAFTDVARQLRRIIAEVQQQKLERNSAASLVMNVPYEQNFLFTGRETLLRRLYEALHSEKTAALTQVQAISGLGGIGKTQTAVEYAYRHQSDYDYIFWVKSDTAESLSSDFLTLADLLPLPRQHARDAIRRIEQAKQWLRTHDRWLLILDNADDLSLVRDYLPRNGKGHTLLTTREQATGGIARKLDVAVMDEEEGALFLLHRAKLLDLNEPLTNATLQEQQTAQHISHLLDGLPLALNQAGAYIEETGCGLQGYVKMYSSKQTELLKRRGKHDNDHLDVTTTFTLAFERVEAKSPLAAEVMRLCAFLDPDTIPEELFTQAADQLGTPLRQQQDNLLLWNDTLSLLLSYSLLQRNPDQTLTMHRLVQSVIQQSMNKATQKRWIERTIRAVNAIFPKVDYSTWQQCQRYLSQVQTCLLLIEQFQMTLPEAAHLFQDVGRYLRDSAQYVQALPFLQRALTLREDISSEHPATAYTLDQLAWLYQETGQYEQAEPLMQRALRIYEQIPEGYSDITITLNNLGLLYREIGQYEQALPLFERAVAIYEKQRGKHPSAATLNNLALLYWDMRQYERALPLFERALAISERLQGEHPETAVTLDNLALLYRDMRQYEQALPLHERALAIKEKQLGEHPDTATTLNNLALLYQDMGQYEQALPLYERALAIKERLLREHSGTATTLENLASLYKEMGQHEKGEPLLHRAQAIREKFER